MRMRAVHYNDLGPVGSNSRRLSATGKQNLITIRAREDTGEIVVVINARFAAVMLGPPFGRVDFTSPALLARWRGCCTYGCQ